MPFTPIHLGPGAAFKALGGSRFSFMVFGGSQVLMDLEPLIGMLRGSAILHGYTHTLIGALGIGAIAALIGKPISEFVLWLLQESHRPLTWFASCTGAFLGTFSHILLDGIMHSDMRPWWPVSDVNTLLGLVSMSTLHWICLALGLIGAAGVGIRQVLEKP